MEVRVVWLGHSTFLFETPNGRIVIDPWLATSPVCPDEHKAIDNVDTILLTHGHFDHIADLFDLQARCESRVVCIHELSQWLGHKGVDESKVIGMGIGGTVRLDELAVSVTMVTARHSSSFFEDGQIIYLGEPAGFVLTFDGGLTIYLAGDTDVFGDMALIRELHHPDVAILPIGDHYTMGPTRAAKAAELLGARKIIPCHYGTFPVLAGTPSALSSALHTLGVQTDVEALAIGGEVTLRG